LKNRQADLDLRHALLDRLGVVAPAWAARIARRDGVHGGSEIPGDPERAWVWRQLNDELERRSAISLEGLQRQSEKLREKLRSVTVDLIDRRAWAFQALRTFAAAAAGADRLVWIRSPHRQRNRHSRPFTAGGSCAQDERVPRRVPVWVMPLSRVVENFDPRVTRFDVVIIDEASQSDVMALLALYLGKVRTGGWRSEQVSPTPVGQDLNMVGNLISQYLQGIPNSHLYDGQISIYDLARQSFGGSHMPG